MPIQQIDIQEFIIASKNHLIIDVRTPAEFAQAHIPNAVSVPIFNDEERVIIGTTYKKQSKEKAIKIGLDFYGPKMRSIVEFVEKQLKSSEDKSVFVHCWRGGMRSKAIAWLLDFYGFKVFLLTGGYKAYRNWVLQQFDKPYHICVLSGNTGSGKTEILNELKNLQQQTIDLENLALHRGSAFGHLGLPTQPSNEMFENLLAHELTEYKQQSIIWVESESTRIGQLNIPLVFFNQMKSALLRININIPFDERLDFICKEYGSFEIKKLIEATQRISKRLGGLETKKTIAHLEQNDIKSAFKILLEYYDRWYSKSKSIYEQAPIEINLQNINSQTNAKLILKTYLQNV